ncbi:sensor histidine kinase [Luteimonas sp. Y-2-2-4F]|nr:sensor histidine kinase [Luteimonas sp. Y-2-2-4F]MCD9032135.1 sensor histidine kinase [Luteimonas sp. Y-2-2-4F]MCD9032270.1 sensor histidine kinase [Luteimonas sp. Y-2-2-4F]
MNDVDALRERYRRLLARLEANEDEFRRLGRSVWRVQEEERRRLARELHDGVGQNLTALKHRLSLLGAELTPAQAALRARVDEAVALCAQTLEDTRQLSRLLRPPILDDLGLEAALRWLARSVGEAGALPVELSLPPLEPPGDEVGTLLFRIAQEALTNVLKHSGARRASLSLRERGGCLELRIEDDGRGCDPGRAAGAGGSGLAGMRERVRLYGGRFEFRSRPGHGTLVRATVPGEAPAPPA